MKTNIIEYRKHEFIEQLKDVLNNTLPVFNINYFLGEDKDTGVRSLYLDIVGKGIGSIFSVFKSLKSNEVPSDIEEQFISENVNNLILAGVVWFNHDKIRKINEVSLRKKHPIQSAPSQVIYLN